MLVQILYPSLAISVIFFMCTIFDYPTINHLFCPSSLLLTSAIPHSRSPQLAEHFLLWLLDGPSFSKSCFRLYI